MASERKLRRQSIVSYLVNCSYHELLSVMREVLPARAESGIKDVGRSYGESSRFDERLVLCLAHRAPKTKYPLHSKTVVWKR
jgi:hypothetical protein